VKIAIYTSYGGFGVPDEVIEWLFTKYPELSKYTDYELERWDGEGLKRNDPRLIEALEQTTVESEISIVEIPDDVNDWYIAEYDGCEWIAEGRTWGR